MSKIMILASKAPWNKSIEIAIVSYNAVKEITHDVDMSSIVFNPIQEGSEIRPSLILKEEEAQSLMDELWNCGLKPSEIKDDALELKSTKYHLEDMRRIAFRYIEHVD